MNQDDRNSLGTGDGVNQAAPQTSYAGGQATPNATDPAQAGQVQGGVVDPVGQDPSQVAGQQVPQEPVAEQPQPQPAQPVAAPGLPKEAEPVARPQTESVPITEVKEDIERSEIPLESREYMEKVDKENLALHRAVVHKGQTVVEPAGADQASVVLPMTRTGVIVGVKKKVTTSARWLAEWCIRVIKMMQGRAVYSPERSEE